MPRCAEFFSSIVVDYGVERRLVSERSGCLGLAGSTALRAGDYLPSKSGDFGQNFRL